MFRYTAPGLDDYFYFCIIKYDLIVDQIHSHTNTTISLTYSVNQKRNERTFFRIRFMTDIEKYVIYTRL